MMKIKEYIGEWLCLFGVVLITVMLIDVLGLGRAIVFGCGLALLVGGVIRIVKNKK